MGMGLAFWIIMLIWGIFGAMGAYRSSTQENWSGLGAPLALFVLLVLLGWKTFGAPIH